MAQLKSQADQRRAHTFKDQHGRGWWASVELKTGHPSEPLRAGPWSFVGGAKLVPVPQKYLVWDDPLNVGNVRIDYTRWRADLRDAKQEYRAAAIRAGRHIHKESFDENEPYTKSVIDEIGQPPHPEEPVIAMEQGNPWMLGLTDVVDERVLKACPSLIPRAPKADPDFRPTGREFAPEPKAEAKAP